MKGILAYEAFNQISDTFVDESYIPGAEVLLAPPARRTRSEREEGALRRFMNSGWGVACISLFVAFAVLAGIIYAGQNPPVDGPVGSLPSETETDNYSGVSQDEVTVKHGDTVIYPRRFLLYNETVDGRGFEGEFDLNHRPMVLPKVYYAKDGSISPCELNLDTGYEFVIASVYGTDMQESAFIHDGTFHYESFLKYSSEILPVGQHYIVLQIKHNSSCYEYAYELVLVESEGDTEIGTTHLPEDTEPVTTYEPSTDPGPETVRPDEPNVEAILAQAEPMIPDIPAGSALVGETALTMWYREDDSRLQKQVSRIAVYRDGDDPYTHYLYADVLDDSGTIRKAETTAIHGYFTLMEFDSTLVLSTMEGELTDNGTYCNAYGIIEAWLSWTDADNMSGEDLGDIRLQRVEYDDWTNKSPLNRMEDVLSKFVMRQVCEKLSLALRQYTEPENFGVLVDFFTETDTPRVYARSDSKGAEAVEARNLILDGAYFDTVWSAFVQRMNDQAAGLDPAPPVPEETTNWEDFAQPMEPDVPDTAVVLGYTYTTDRVTRNGETFEAISRIALYGFREEQSEFFLYRDVLAENGEIIATDTRTLPTLFGLAQSSLDGSLQLYTVSADRQNNGTARLGLTVQSLSWSDVGPTGESVGEVKAWVTPCEEASWVWEESTAIMANKGMDYGWQVHAFDIGECWLQNTRTYWNQTLGELGMEDSGYLTFLLDKLLNVKLGDMYVLHPEDDEETRMGTYFFLSTGSDHLETWFQYYMSGLGFRP